MILVGKQKIIHFICVAICKVCFYKSQKRHATATSHLLAFSFYGKIVSIIQYLVSDSYINNLQLEAVTF